ncbi:MAG TPA: gamma-glutamyltransferase family protein [Bellilinea sp.]|nr:gamma-glutamyltransferase family protein [Bellilinea sp.]
MCASSQPLASAVGISILNAGGSAADAGVSMAAALNVTEPTSTGLGGDVFVLYFQASDQKVYAINGSGRAPASLTLARLQKEGFGQTLPAAHPYTITVPGACAAWVDLLQRFGRMSLEKVLAPAIDLAEQGFPVAPITAWFWDRAAKNLLAKSVNGRELTLAGQAPHAGELFRNPGLARTLRSIAEGGKTAYYQGEIGHAIAAVIAEAGGCLAESDLAAHTSTWVEPISVDYRGLRVWECPPNGQGLAALIALNILKGFDLQDQDPSGADRFHLMIEAMRLAFADAFQYIADPEFSQIPLAGLLSEGYASERRKLIDPKAVMQKVMHGRPPAISDTVYFCAVDEEGNACSFIASNYMGFGTGIVPSGWGFSLQNRGHNFSLDPASPNALAPGKRPYHTIIPALATDALTGALIGPLGVMGGFMQPQGHLQVVVGLTDDRFDPQAVLDRPRFCLTPESPSPRVAIEEGVSAETVARLAEMGHPLETISGMGRATFGRGQIILRDPQTGVLCGGSDPRADGCAIPQV